jgi:NAD(P)-dependent dehydrogenase (short-subunit alcohol dehydrogenase family)
MDLSSFTSIKDAVAPFTSHSQRLTLLSNNAGIMACPMRETVDGYEIQFGTNHMGHALLTKLLLPTVLSTAKEPGADVRIVNLSSMRHQMAPSGGIILDKATLVQRRPWARCGQSKLANILYTKQLPKRCPSVKTIAVHPDNIETDLWAHNVKINWFVRCGVTIFGRFWLEVVAKGARNQLGAAVAKEVGSGAYYTSAGHKTSGSDSARNEKLAEELL